MARGGEGMAETPGIQIVGRPAQPAVVEDPGNALIGRVGGHHRQGFMGMTIRGVEIEFRDGEGTPGDTPQDGIVEIAAIRRQRTIIDTPVD
jgi:hypothetical protein